MAAAARDQVDWVYLFMGFLACLLFALVAGVIGLIVYGLWLELSSGRTEYTVTLAGVEGLDAAALRARRSEPLSPVFDVAVRIDNSRYKGGKRCVGKHSSAVVSYRDAVLGRGTVPEFCAKALGLGETEATAWAMDVRMPRFLRTRLARELESGEAVLDVAVRAPGSGGCYMRKCMGTDVPLRTTTPGDETCYVYRCRDLLLDCKAKIGGGPSPPCLVTEVDQGSTGTDSVYWI
jgi:hypothetical protein